MQQFIGSSIRKLRREQNLTQSALGGTAFSKSYVSAVESNKLMPSKEALRHFALSLGKPADYFWLLAQRDDTAMGTLLAEEVALSDSDAFAPFASARIALLEPFLDQSESDILSHFEGDFTLSKEVLSLLTSVDQAHYGFFRGLMLRKQKDYLGAIEELELAMAREPHSLHTIRLLYELGMCYSSMHLPHIALSYMLRARRRILQETDQAAASTLFLAIELEGGNLALALGTYQQALEFFEQAQSYLNARQSMEKVGRLYCGLGYSAYAFAYQQASLSEVENEVIEHLYQRGSSYLLQSRNIAQMAGDHQGARMRRVMLAMLQLDWCTWRWRTGDIREARSRDRILASLPALLDDANEQCRQVLASFQARTRDGVQKQQDQTEEMFIALALLVRVAVQRALLACAQGYESTFQRERSFASFLCQQALDACTDPTLIESIAWNIGGLTDVSAALSFSPLPRLPVFSPQLEETPSAVYRSLAEVFFAAGEVAEMLGRTATDADFATNCYTRADSAFQRALEGFRLSQVGVQLDGGYVARVYQRYTLWLEERIQREQEQERDISQATHGLLALCKQQLTPAEYHWPF